MQVRAELPATAARATISIEPRDFPTNRGGLCQKGWTAGELLTSAERLTQPLIRRSSRRAAAPGRLGRGPRPRGRTLPARSGRSFGADRVAVFGGGGLTNEKAYLLGKFARVALGTPNIDYNGRFCMSSAAAAGNRAFGVDRGLPFPLEDLASADVILLAGSNAAETMPPFMRWIADQDSAGGSLIVIDPRRTPTARRAALHLAPTPGTDLALANGLLHIAIAAGAVDSAYIAAAHDRFRGRPRCRGGVLARTRRGHHRRDGRRAAVGRAHADRGRTRHDPDGSRRRAAQQRRRHGDVADQPGSRARAARPAGKRLRMPDRPGQRTGRSRARPEGRPAAGLSPHRRSRGARSCRRRLGRRSGNACPAPDVPRTNCSMPWAPPDGPRALLVAGSNIAVSAPRSTHIADRLQSLDFLVVCDIVPSETAALADVVLPVTQWAEEGGTMTNLEGRVLLREPALAPPPNVRSDLDVLVALAGGSTHPGSWPRDPESVFAELCRASQGGPADYAGMSYARIAAQQGLFWPCPDADHPGHAPHVHRPLRDRRRPRPLHRRSAPNAGRADRAAVPAAPDDRADSSALPERSADPPDPRATQGGPGAVRRGASRRRRSAGAQRRRTGRRRQPPRARHRVRHG